MGLFGRVGRANQITATVVRHGLGHYLFGTEPKTGQRLEGPKAAKRFRAVLEDLGPTFIKFGQVLSTRPDLLPPGFAEALRGLQDNCPPMKAGDAQQVIEESLGAPIGDLFESFGEEPIASASIAEVHRAKTKDGRDVAVKVRRLGIRKQITRDLDLMRLVARLVEAILAEAGMVAPTDLVEEFERAFLKELDFGREVRMLRRFRENCPPGERTYEVPEVIEELSSDRVVTMTFIEGTKLNELRDDHSPALIAEHLVIAAFKQLFEDGLFHADPHPGNIFVLADSRIAFVDLGSVGEVSPAMRRDLLAFSVALALRDADSAARLIYRAGISSRRVSLYELRSDLERLFGKYLQDFSNVGKMSSAELMSDLLALVQSYRLRLPREYALMARAVMITEGSIRSLDPTMEVVKLAEPFAEELLADELELPSVRRGAMRQFIRFRSLTREVPVSLWQVVSDMERGRFEVGIRGAQLERLGRSIEALGITIFLGLIASGLVTGSFFLLSRFEINRWIPIGGMALACLFLGAAMGRYWFSPFWRRLTRGNWLTSLLPTRSKRNRS